MPDDRSLREKLEAMANQDASPQEAEVARAMLEKMPATPPRIETRRVLTREDVMAAPDRVSMNRKGVAVRFPSGRWVHMYEDEVNWQLVEGYRMPWRWEGDSQIHYPKGATPDERARLA